MKKISGAQKLLTVAIAALCALISFRGVGIFNKKDLTVQAALQEIHKSTQQTIRQEKLVISKEDIKKISKKTIKLVRELAGSTDPNAKVPLFDFYELKKDYLEALKLHAKKQK